MAKHRVTLRSGTLRKHNAFLDNCAEQCNSEALRKLILCHKLTWKGFSARIVMKGTNSHV